MIKIPEKLKNGDAVGIVAPASPFDEMKLKEGGAILESMGFKVTAGDMLSDVRGYLSASDAVRADQIHQYFADGDIKAILCARGGYGAIRILSKLNYDVIKKNPKIFMGFSDVTVLLTALYQKCRMAVYHGPMVAGLSDADRETRDAMKHILTFPGDLEFSFEHIKVLRAGKARGPVIGGNLTSLCHLAGTPYGMNFNGHILFLEDRGEALYRIDRMLMHLKLAGCLEGIKGLILGTFEECGHYGDIENLAEELLNETDIPILAGFEAGHGGRNLAIPLGVPAVIDTDERIFLIQQQVVFK